MARIRSIKPEFPQSESMGKVSRDARLLFVNLWTLCDDEGRTRGSSRMLASLLFPYDDDAPGLIDGWLSELERENCIQRYVVDGNSYVQVLNWLNHQKIDRPSASKLPAFAKARESSRSVPVGREGKGEERRGKDKAPSVLPVPAGAGTADPTKISERVAKITDDAIDAYNRLMAEPLGLVKATKVGIARKRANVQAALQTIREVCREAYGSERIEPRFWEDYFTAQAADDFLAGRTGRSKGHENWRPDFEYLLKPKNITKAFEKAVAA